MVVCYGVQLSGWVKSYVCERNECILYVLGLSAW